MFGGFLEWPEWVTFSSSAGGKRYSVVRRLIVLLALAGVTCLGFGSALVVAQSSANVLTTTLTQTGPGNNLPNILICHATGSSSHPFVVNAPDANADAGGHGNHPNDIIPPYVVVDTTGTTIFSYTGKNMTTPYGDWSGVDVLNNNCVIPTTSVSTTTVTSISSTTSTETESVPGTTVTSPAVTTTTVVTVTVTLPANTVTEAGTTTVVTDPPGPPTTVTLPSQTITLPVSTDMKTTVVTITTPGHVVTLPAHVITHVEGAKAVVRTILKKIFTPLVRACAAASGPGKG
jgi:hypothetical protein